MKGQLGRRERVMAVCAFSALLLGALVALAPVPYAILAPGPATNTLGTYGGKPLITVSGHQIYPAKGALDFTTVQVYGGPGFRVSLVQMLRGWLSRERAVVPEEQLFPPGETSEQVDAENAAEMAGSQQSAAAAALTELGLPVTELAKVGQVEDSSPAKGKLRAGDVITAVDGTPVAGSAALRSAVQSRKPGQSVTLTVQRGGKTMEVITTTTSSQGRTVLGVVLDPSYQLPFKVSIGTKDVGGPSAGMMFALGLYDVLTPGDLTGGKKVAGTGTIEANGTVGPIGGIAQKMVGAHDAGARWFLAPKDNCGEVVGNVPDGLRVVKVGTLHEARTAVQAIAAGQASGLPTCTR